MVEPTPQETLVECDFLISSGMLIPVDVLSVVGGMEEALFIDHVDTEWCLRASDKGYACFGVGDAWMEHQLGTGSRIVWLGRWRRVPLHPPERCYFIARNGVKLLQRPYMPAAWKRHTILRMIGLMLFNGVLSCGGLARLKGFLRGLAAGMAQPEETSRPGSIP
jgi:rhamnosyltransferase